MRSYAQDTNVPISASRIEIDALLRAWGADGVQWTDEFTLCPNRDQHRKKGA